MTAVRRVDEAGIARVTIEVPRRRNALSRTVLEGIRGHVLAANADGARGVVLTGSEGVFSAGADFAELSGDVGDLDYDAAVEAVADTIRACSIPVVAAVEGPCMGAAVDLALSCDAITAGRGSFFEVPAGRMGILYNPKAIARMHARVPRPMLARMLIFGERISIEEAAASGGLAAVVSQGSAESAARELIQGRGHASKDAIAATKSLLNDLDDGAADLSHYGDVRRTLLDSDERAHILQRKKR